MTRLQETTSAFIVQTYTTCFLKDTMVFFFFFFFFFLREMESQDKRSAHQGKEDFRPDTRTKISPSLRYFRVAQTTRRPHESHLIIDDPGHLRLIQNYRQMRNRDVSSHSDFLRFLFFPDQRPRKFPRCCFAQLGTAQPDGVRQLSYETL